MDIREKATRLRKVPAMKILPAFSLTLFILTLLAPVSSAQEKRSSASPSPALPSDENFKEHARWNIRCAERVGAMIGKRCDILFIGDSITQNFSEEPDGRWSVGPGLVLPYLPDEQPFALTGRSVWEKHYAGRNVLNFGVGSDRTGNILWRMENMDIQSFSPRVVVVLAGTNDTPHSTPTQIAAGVRAILDKSRRLYPGSRIILISLLPSARNLDKITATNAIIRHYADDTTIHYFDLHSLMTPTGQDSWKGIGRDHIHLTTEGYELWATSMEPLLSKLLTLPPLK